MPSWCCSCLHHEIGIGRAGLPDQELQLVAERCILQGLKAAGIVRGEVEDLLQRRMAALFMPHGPHGSIFGPHSMPANPEPHAVA